MRFAVSAMSLFLAAPAVAEAPRVATDILPVHSLVARVMEGVGEPDLILPPGASPHGYAMRPSEAAILEQSDIVFWIGEGLTPWLERPLDVVASNATKIELLEVPGTILLEFDDEHGHDDHADEHGDEEHAHDDHDHDEHGHDDHAEKDDHDEHGHDDHAEKDGHDDHEHGHEEHAEEADDHGHEEHASDGHDDHDHGPIDPHAWLDPENAKVWLTAIEGALSTADPENAPSYAKNAEEARGELDELLGELSTALNDDALGAYALYHDAYGYFEDRFDISATAILLDGDAAQPSPQRIANNRETVVSQSVQNVFVEPNTNVSLIETIFDGLSVNICEIDPLGSSTPAGPKHYWQSMRTLAETIGTCGAS